MKQSFNQSFNHSVNHSINHSFNQSNNQSIIQSVSQAFNQSVNQSINQLVNQSINLSINQSISQSISQSINQSIFWFGQRIFLCKCKESYETWDSNWLFYAKEETGISNKKEINNGTHQIVNEDVFAAQKVKKKQKFVKMSIAYQ